MVGAGRFFMFLNYLYDDDDVVKDHNNHICILMRVSMAVKAVVMKKSYLYVHSIMQRKMNYE